ncbi:hypothetical protein [Micromonospora sp. NPDC005189]|uniref:hypothetical protein n=1 Tax=unclassified Micromonospora TaxID=2617518 RepID=UPI0033A55071
MDVRTRSGDSCSAGADRINVRQAYASVAELHIGLLGSREQMNPADLAFIGRHLATRAGNARARVAHPDISW